MSRVLAGPQELCDLSIKREVMGTRWDDFQRKYQRGRILEYCNTTRNDQTG